MLQNDLTLLKISNLSFGYNQNKVLANISFSITQGEYVGIIGPNGGGKTTLMKLILGILKPQEGEILINGTKISNFNNWRQIGYVPQKVSQSTISFPATVQEIVESSVKINKKPWEKLTGFETRSLEKAIEISDIEHLLNRQIHDLSGGERQRVFLARSLATQPKILILDEPTVGVDAATQDKFYEFLKHLNKNHKITILFVSHDLPVVSKQTSRVLCLNHQLFEDQDPKDLLHTDFMEKVYGNNFRFITHHHDF